MKGGEPNKVQPQPDIANLDQSEINSSQGETVVPIFAGERKFAITIISPVYNMRSKDSQTGGKK